MQIKLGGPQSEIEAAAQRKLIKEKDIKEILSNDSISLKELRSCKIQIRELLEFYDRIILSIDATVKTVKSKTQLTYQEKKDRYLIMQERELSQAKSEKSKFRRYLKKVNDRLDESNLLINKSKNGE